MKKFFLGLVFVLGTATISNANDDCIHVSLSCGVEYDVCNFQGTTTQLVNSVLNANNNVCGTDFPML
jgi:hypothetical protein